MNLLEHYILKIHKIKELEKYPDMIEVDVTCNCYGVIKRTPHTTSKQQWAEDVYLGYFMA